MELIDAAVNPLPESPGRRIFQPLSFHPCRSMNSPAQFRTQRSEASTVFDGCVSSQSAHVKEGKKKRRQAGANLCCWCIRIIPVSSYVQWVHRSRTHWITFSLTFKHCAESQTSSLASATPMLASNIIRSHSDSMPIVGTVQIGSTHDESPLGLYSEHSRSDA